MEQEYGFTCPHCWQAVSMMLDLSVRGQTLIQDCEVCCNPIEIAYAVRDGAVDAFELRDMGQ